MQYERLDNNQKKQLLEQRLTQYEAEHYQHSLNKHLLEQSGDASEQTKFAMKQADDAMATLDHAYHCCQEELVKLDGDAAPEPEPAPPAPAQAAPNRATRRSKT